MKIPLHDYMDENNQYHVLFDECKQAFQLDPHERVIDMRKVKELAKEMDELLPTSNTWKYLKKELGVE